jgi:hypothetical protein
MIHSDMDPSDNETFHDSDYTLSTIVTFKNLYVHRNATKEHTSLSLERF